MNRIEDYVTWGAKRDEKSVRLSPPGGDGLPTAEPETLQKYYPQAELGGMQALATIVDGHGRILTIHLLQILSLSWLVRVLSIQLLSC
jgi:hypothetical protein